MGLIEFKYGLIFIAKCMLRAIYVPMKCFIKTKSKIVYLSRQSDVKSLDMLLLAGKLKEWEPECCQVFRLRTVKEGLVGKIRYCIGILGDMYHMAGAKLVICDTYSIPVSCLVHKKSLTIVQLWHAMGAIKKFGLQSVGREEGREEKLSHILQMHENYNYVLAPAKITAEFYSEAFGINIRKIIIATLPHIDYILDGKTKKPLFLKYNPEFQGKKIVLYLPTFREEEEKIVDHLEETFEKEGELKLLVSLHPLSNVRKKEKYKVNGGLSTYDLMKLADYIITDYSACAFEAAVLEKPLYFYVPDYTIYEKRRGLNIDLKSELSDCVFEKSEELYVRLTGDEYDFNALTAFRRKYIENTENCTEKVAKFMAGML